MILDNWDNINKLKFDLVHFRLDLLKIEIALLILAFINPIGFWQDSVWYLF